MRRYTEHEFCSLDRNLNSRDFSSENSNERMYQVISDNEDMKERVRAYARESDGSSYA